MVRSTRRRAEAAIAFLFAGGIVAAGVGALVFFLTISPVHTDPGAVPSIAAAAPDERYSSAVARARRLARSLVVDENLPGLSIAVAHDGRVVWAEGFGWADVEGRAPATPLTRFRIGGVSMPLTAAAVGLLHERGRLDLDAPVQRYVPAFPAKEWAIATRQLMGHVAGVRGPRFEGESLPVRHCARLDEALQIFGGDPLVFRPGTEYRESIYGWVLVSAVVEGAAGEPFPEFVRREVFGPAGMESTVLDEPGGLPGLASSYFPRAFERPDLGLQRDAPPVDYSCWAGAGAFVSTPTDLARFGSSMLKPGVLTAGTLALLQAPLRLESGASTGYALGWKVETVQLAGAPRRMLGHRGGAVGGTAALMTFPDFDLAIAAASNVSYARAIAPFGLQVAEAFAKR
jgi:CubicO group peptidase (beta-lactamase class C family)